VIPRRATEHKLFNTCHIITDTEGGRGARFLRSLFPLNVIYVPSTYANTCTTRQQEHCPARQHTQSVLGVFWTGCVMNSRVGLRKVQKRSSSSEHSNRTTQSTAATHRTKTVEFERSGPHQQRLDLTASKLLKWDDPQLVFGHSSILAVQIADVSQSTSTNVALYSLVGSYLL
jgi:hypothetical protein